MLKIGLQCRIPVPECPRREYMETERKWNLLVQRREENVGKRSQFEKIQYFKCEAQLSVGKMKSLEKEKNLERKTNSSNYNVNCKKHRERNRRTKIGTLP